MVNAIPKPKGGGNQSEPINRIGNHSYMYGMYCMYVWYVLYVCMVCTVCMYGMYCIYVWYVLYIYVCLEILK